MYWDLLPFLNQQPLINADALRINKEEMVWAEPMITIIMEVKDAIIYFYTLKV